MNDQNLHRIMERIKAVERRQHGQLFVCFVTILTLSFLLGLLVASEIVLMHVMGLAEMLLRVIERTFIK